MSRRNLKIIFVTAVYPHALEYGAQQRVLNICRLLSKLGKLSIAMVASEPIDQHSLAKTGNEFDVAHVALLQMTPLASLVERARFELDPDFMNTHFNSIREADRESLLRLIGDNDLVWVHTLRTANECGIYRWPHTVLDIDDIPSRVYRSRVHVESTTTRKLLNYRMAVIWQRRERRVPRRFEITTVCSQSDRDYLGNTGRVHIIPNGCMTPEEQPNRVHPAAQRVGFIGWFKSMPNVDGVEWFIQSVWPLVKKKIPQARLRLVGEDTDRDFSGAGPDIDGLGYLDDLRSEIASWSAMIVPIRVGGGTRVKIAKALSRKCPVVSTSLGTFGYNVIDGEEILIANDPLNFAAACVKLINDPEFGATIAENAWRKFLTNWTWNSIGPAVESVVEHCLATNRGGSCETFK
jgi:glycosyltransferase involved in cell wall biosynthesis